MNEAFGSSRLMMCGAMREGICKHCGKRYMHTDEHVYKGCCSYTCMRAGGYDKLAWGKKANFARNRQKIEEKIDKCLERIDHFQGIADAAKAGTKSRNTALKNVRDWTYKLEEARMMLDEIKRKTDGKR